MRKPRIIISALCLAATAVLSGAGIAAASTPPTIPNVPTGGENTFYNVAGRGTWYDSGGVIYSSPYATYFTATSGTYQEYVLYGTNLCATYNASAGDVDVITCAGKTSQEWRSNQLSNGAWNVKNEYLGNNECAYTSGSGARVGFQTCVSGSTPQEWDWVAA